MRFAVMARILNYHGYGIKTGLVGLLRGISEIDTPHEIILFVDPSQSLGDDIDAGRFRLVPVPPATGSMSGKFWWDHLAVGRACKRLQVDALYAPAHVRPAYAPCPVVVLIWDMMYHLFPDYWRTLDRAYMSTAVSLLTPRATLIAAPSSSTKQDIVSVLSVPEQKVRVTYPGRPEGFHPLPAHVSARIRAEHGLHKPFVLFVGSFRSRKNLTSLVKAFEEIAERVPHELVVIARPVSGEESVLSRLQASPYAHRMRYLGLVEHSQLPLFYNEADLFVFPSSYEGFGFPVLEAMACGCPTITTNVSSLPEVAGDAAILVAPTDTAELGAAIHRVLADESLRTQLSQRGLRQSQRFSWSSTASQVLSLLEEASALR